MRKVCDESGISIVCDGDGEFYRREYVLRGGAGHERKNSVLILQMHDGRGVQCIRDASELYQETFM